MAKAALLSVNLNTGENYCQIFGGDDPASDAWGVWEVIKDDKGWEGYTTTVVADEAGKDALSKTRMAAWGFGTETDPPVKPDPDA